jgi:thiol-disulfide isomerase/thioredoxin
MKTIFLLALLTTATLSFSQTVVEIDDSGEFHTLKNKPAPNFSSGTLDNHEIKLGDFRDRIVLLHFWSLSCAACFKELPELNEIVKKYANEKFVIISLMDDSKEELLAKFDVLSEQYKMKRQVFGNDKIDFQIVPDAKEIMKLYTDEIAFPQTFILDASGTITFYMAGYAAKRGFPGEITSEGLFIKEIDRLIRSSR